MSFVDETRSKAAALSVEACICFEFSVDDFTKIWKMWQIGLVRSETEEQQSMSVGYCSYSPASKRNVNRPKVVGRIANVIDTAEKYQTLLGFPTAVMSVDAS